MANTELLQISEFGQLARPCSAFPCSPPLLPHWHIALFPYRTRCRGSVTALQRRMNMPLATIMPALFTGGRGAGVVFYQ